MEWWERIKNGFVPFLSFFFSKLRVTAFWIEKRMQLYDAVFFKTARRLLPLSLVVYCGHCTHWRVAHPLSTNRPTSILTRNVFCIIQLPAEG